MIAALLPIELHR